MKIITVKTGLGYFTDSQGNIIARSQLPQGEHPLKDGFDYVEVTNQAVLDAIVVYREPETIKQQQDRLITQTLREIAEFQLRTERKWPE